MAKLQNNAVIEKCNNCQIKLSCRLWTGFEPPPDCPLNNCEVIEPKGTRVEKQKQLAAYFSEPEDMDSVDKVIFVYKSSHGKE